jgi:acetylornithine/succinyldiaminopimelate/putrescine aminotransferase
MASALSITQSAYSEHVNPQWVHLLNVLQMNVGCQRCEGAELHTTEGTRALDFLSGYNPHANLTGTNFMVLKVAPPLMVSEGQIETSVTAMKNIGDAMHTSDAFWQEAGIWLTTGWNTGGCGEGRPSWRS